LTTRIASVLRRQSVVRGAGLRHVTSLSHVLLFRIGLHAIGGGPQPLVSVLLRHLSEVIGLVKSLVADSLGVLLSARVGRRRIKGSRIPGCLHSMGQTARRRRSRGAAARSASVSTREIRIDAIHARLALSLIPIPRAIETGAGRRGCRSSATRLSGSIQPVSSPLPPHIRIAGNHDHTGQSHHAQSSNHH